MTQVKKTKTKELTVYFKPIVKEYRGFENYKDVRTLLSNNETSNSLYMVYYKDEHSIHVHGEYDIAIETEQWKTFDQDKKQQIAESIAGLKESTMFTRLMNELADKVQG